MLSVKAETRSNRRKRMEFCNALIAKKIEGYIETLETSLRRSEVWDKAMRRARDDLIRLASDPPQTVDALRLLEAQSAVTYFRAWHATSLLWRASARHPIPTNGEPSDRGILACTPAEAATQLTPSTPS